MEQLFLRRQAGVSKGNPTRSEAHTSGVLDTFPQWASPSTYHASDFVPNTRAIGRGGDQRSLAVPAPRPQSQR